MVVETVTTVVVVAGVVETVTTVVVVVVETVTTVVVVVVVVETVTTVVVVAGAVEIDHETTVLAESAQAVRLARSRSDCEHSEHTETRRYAHYHRSSSRSHGSSYAMASLVFARRSKRRTRKQRLPSS